MNRFKLLVSIALMAAGAALLVAASRSSDRPKQSSIQRGKYLVTALGCTDCHTPHKMGPAGPEPDLTLFLAGHPEKQKIPPPPSLPRGPWIAVSTGDTAWAGPWGISYSANLTPDNATGLGIWTEEMFLKTLRAGKHMSAGRALLPPMPWQSLSQLTDEDLKAIYAYLRTVPPVKNRVPEPVPPTGPHNLE